MGTGIDKTGRLGRVLKYVGLGGTAISAIVGAAIATMTLYDTVKAKAGYEEHSQILEKVVDDTSKNREEIRFLYKALLTSRTVSNPVPRAAPVPAPPSSSDRRGGRSFHRRREAPTPRAPAVPREQRSVKDRLDRLPEAQKRYVPKSWDNLKQQKAH